MDLGATVSPCRSFLRHAPRQIFVTHKNVYWQDAPAPDPAPQQAPESAPKPKGCRPHRSAVVEKTSHVCSTTGCRSFLHSREDRPAQAMGRPMAPTDGAMQWMTPGIQVCEEGVGLVYSDLNNYP